MNQNILFIPLEFQGWQQGRSLAYPSQLGLEEGLRAADATVLTLPTLHGVSSSAPASWLRHAQRLCAGKKFDQVWVEIVHSSLDEDMLIWLSSIAPVRVGFLLESLQYDSEVYNHAPHLLGRKALVSNRLRHFTHVMAADEKDADEIEQGGAVRAMWWPQAVPSQFVESFAPPMTSDFAVFYGALYGDRASWFNHPKLQGLLRAPQPSLEHATRYPGYFDELMKLGVTRLEQGVSPSMDLLENFLGILRHIRQEIFRLWLRSLQTGCAVVNLPSFFNGYPGRVFEAMAAGRPVITPRLHDRPQTSSLFTEGEEILLFDKNAPDELADCIRRVKMDRKLSQRLAENALHTVRALHTVERRVLEILTWIESGNAPSYGNLRT